MAQVQPHLEQKALALHRKLLTVDTHCDTPMRLGGSWDIGARHAPGEKQAGCQDFHRMRDGGLTASFFAVFTNQGPLTEDGRAKAYAKALAQLDHLDRMFARYPDLCERALTVEDAQRIHRQGKRAIFLGLENGYPLGLDVSRVETFAKRGIRYITLSHIADNDLCDASTDPVEPSDKGLSPLGADVVRRMNDLGVMVDVSHISEKAFYDVLKVTRAPVLASHSCARALCDHPRNLTDDQLRALKANGGVIQICILTDYLKPMPKDPAKEAARKALEAKAQALGGWDAITDPKVLAALDEEWEAINRASLSHGATVKDVVDHIDHVVKVIGVDHVGIGTDFDGGGGIKDCSDVTHLPRITVELMRRGYTPDAIAKIWGGNFLRVMRRAEALRRSA